MKFGLIHHRSWQDLGTFGNFRHLVFPFNGHHMHAVYTLHLLELFDLFAGYLNALIGHFLLADPLQAIDKLFRNLDPGTFFCMYLAIPTFFMGVTPARM